MGLNNLTQTRETTTRSVKVEGDEDSFFVVKVLFTMNLHLMAIVSTNNATLK